MLLAHSVVELTDLGLTQWCKHRTVAPMHMRETKPRPSNKNKILIRRCEHGVCVWQSAAAHNTILQLMLYVLHIRKHTQPHTHTHTSRPMRWKQKSETTTYATYKIDQNENTCYRCHLKSSLRSKNQFSENTSHIAHTHKSAASGRKMKLSRINEKGILLCLFGCVQCYMVFARMFSDVSHHEFSVFFARQKRLFVSTGKLLTKLDRRHWSPRFKTITKPQTQEGASHCKHTQPARTHTTVAYARRSSPILSTFNLN